jgi:TonB family protein
MKVLSTLVVCSGLTLATAVFGQFGPQVPEWQSVKIVQTVDPVFPFPLTQQGLTRGEARVAVNTDAKGRLVEWLVVGFTRAEFANEAVDVIKKWAFVPARMRGEPVGTTIEIYFYFEARGVVVSTTTIDELERATLFETGRYVYQPCSLRELDRIPTPLTTVAPVYPAELARKGVHGRVSVDFYIDETGVVRMPAVSPRDNSELTVLSLEALRQWRFEPPTRNGKPVLVKASQVFSFGSGN